jgi:hypothetical protein
MSEKNDAVTGDRGVVDKVLMQFGGPELYQKIEMQDWKLYRFRLIGDIQVSHGGRYDRESRYVNVENVAVDPAERRTLWLPTVLYNKLRDLQVGPGDDVGIIPKGKLESQKGRYYTDFAVFKWTKDVDVTMAAVTKVKQTEISEPSKEFPRFPDK